MILAGGIGGMKTNVAIFERDEQKLSAAVVVQRGFPSAEYETPDARVEEFVTGQDLKVTRGLASTSFGSVVAGRVETPNLKSSFVEAMFL